jgi:predicted transcriptional regulator
MSDPVSDAEPLIALTTEIVSAHVSNNAVAVGELPVLIRTVHDALAALGAEPAAAEQRPDPAVPVRHSVRPDHIVCLEDGKKLKMLKRHLMVHYGLTPDQYRRRWNLPADYPMVAPDYAERRRTLAHAIGLGKRPRSG